MFSTSMTNVADASLEFGTRLIPSLLIEEKQGILQVYAKNGGNIVPEKIEGLTATSLDSSILRVIDVKSNESGYTSEITILGVKTGTTKIFLAAPGFSATEISIKVNGNKLTQEQFLLKIVPSTVSLDGIPGGYISVELADEDGFPVLAKEDITISLSSSNPNVAKPFQDELTIKKGEYFAVAQFTAQDSGTATIYASSSDIETESTKVTVQKETDLELAFYIFPKTVNSKDSHSTAHLIAQLQREGNVDPVIANEDINIEFKITSDAFGGGSSSNDDILDKFGNFKIFKGEYWGYKPITTLPNSDPKQYTITVSSADPLTLEILELKTVENMDDGDETVTLELVPILATGKRELIGVAHIVNSGLPVNADKDLRIRIDSSDIETVSVDEIVIREASGSALVYGKIGHTVVESDLDIRAAAIGSNLVNVDISGPSETSLKVTAQPLISKVLSGTHFPILLYLEDSANEVIAFPKDYDLFVSPSEFVEIESLPIKQGNNYVVLDAESLEEGSDTLTIQLDEIKTTVQINSLSSEPARIHLDHSESIFVGTNDIFSLQLLNSGGLPIFASEDVEIQFVLEDESLIGIPPKVTIKEGEYFSLFDVAPKKSGVTKLSALTENLPLASFDIKITDLIPKIKISAPDIIENGEVFTATITVEHDNIPLSGLDVKWKVVGGVVQLSDRKTGSTGEAIISIIGQSNDRINIEADVSDPVFYSPTKITKLVKVNSTASEFTAFADEGIGSGQFEKFEIGGFDPLIIIVPAAIVLVGYMLLKQNSQKIKKPTVEAKTT